MIDLSQQGPNFTRIMEILLTGKAICPYRYESFNQILADEEGADRRLAEAMLLALGRRLDCQNGIFYAVYEGRGEEVRRRVETLFHWYRANMRLICEFFDLAQQALKRDALAAGDRFSFSELNDRIANAHNLVDRLLRLYLTTGNRRKDPEPEVALRTLVDKLVEHGFLHLATAQPQQYVITGEMALFEGWRNFVAELEEIDLEGEEEAEEEVPVETQESLL